MTRISWLDNVGLFLLLAVKRAACKVPWVFVPWTLLALIAIPVIHFRNPIVTMDAAATAVAVHLMMLYFLIRIASLFLLNQEAHRGEKSKFQWDAFRVVLAIFVAIPFITYLTALAAAMSLPVYWFLDLKWATHDVGRLIVALSVAAFISTMIMVVYIMFFVARKNDWGRRLNMLLRRVLSDPIAQEADWLFARFTRLFGLNPSNPPSRVSLVTLGESGRR